MAGHLFGRERISLQPVRSALLDTFGAKCFYCGAGLRSNSPVDHVLPWSRVGIDGLANLVPACERCNSDKSNALPVITTVTRVLGRDRSLLNEIGSQIGWPVQYERVCRAARGLYRDSPVGAPTWQSRKTFTPLDLQFEPAPCRPGNESSRTDCARHRDAGDQRDEDRWPTGPETMTAAGATRATAAVSA